VPAQEGSRTVMSNCFGCVESVPPSLVPPRTDRECSCRTPPGVRPLSSRFRHRFQRCFQVRRKLVGNCRNRYLRFHFSVLTFRIRKQIGQTRSVAQMLEGSFVADAFRLPMKRAVPPLQLKQDPAMPSESRRPVVLHLTPHRKGKIFACVAI
jgi:hypothetical protein